MIKLSSSAFNRLTWDWFSALQPKFLSGGSQNYLIKLLRWQLGRQGTMKQPSRCSQVLDTHLEIKTGDQFYRVKSVYEDSCDEGFCLLSNFHKQEKHLSCRVVNLTSLHYTKVCRVTFSKKKKPALEAEVNNQINGNRYRSSLNSTLIFGKISTTRKTCITSDTDADAHCW